MLVLLSILPNYKNRDVFTHIAQVKSQELPTAGYKYRSTEKVPINVANTIFSQFIDTWNIFFALSPVILSNLLFRLRSYTSEL